MMIGFLILRKTSNLLEYSDNQKGINKYNSDTRLCHPIGMVIFFGVMIKSYHVNKILEPSYLKNFSLGRNKFQKLLQCM